MFQDIDRAVAAAWRRLVAQKLVQTLMVALAAALSLALLAVVVARTFGLDWPFHWILSGLGASAVLGACVWTAVAAPSKLAAARVLDERAELKESLSTALVYRASDDPWAQAVIETARVRASGVKVSQALPMEWPRLAALPICAGAALVIAWVTYPRLDVLKIAQAREQKQDEARKVVEVKAAIDAKNQKLEQLLAKANVKLEEELEQDAGEAGQASEVKGAEEIRREQVKRLTSLAEQLREMRGGEEGQQLDALKESLRQLRQAEPGPMDEFGRSLAQGDFKGAQEAMADLAKKLTDGSMSPQEKAQAAKQLDNMAKQLEKIAKDTQRASERMQKSGLDPEAAKKIAEQMRQNPEAAKEMLKKALEQAQNMSPEQKQQLMKQMEGLAKSSAQCQSMGESMKKMAEGMQSQGMSQEMSEAMQQMGESLSQAEQLDAEMSNLEAAMGECQSQLGEMGEGAGQCQGGEEWAWGDTGEWSEGDSDKAGQGSGGPGQGMGQSPEAQAAAYQLDPTKAPVKRTAGPIIGSRLVQGEQVRGESVAEFAQAAEAGAKAATEAINSDAVPREMHDAVKHYFGRLERRAKGGNSPTGQAAGAPAKPAGEATKPADDKK